MQKNDVGVNNRPHLSFFCDNKFLLVNRVHATSSSSNTEWQSGLAFGLPAYNTTIEANDTLYFDEFTWDDINASQITFPNVYMDTGTPVSSLTLSSINANLSFTQLSATAATFNSTSATTNGTAKLHGFKVEPSNITINGMYVST